MSEADRKIIEQLVAGLLARREHSLAELRAKLAARELDSALCEQVLADFTQRGWQSDERFACLFARQRSQKGQGELRIRGELQQRQVASALIEQALAELDVDWFAAAKRAHDRKYLGRALDFKEKQRRARYLQYKGFSHEQIRYALESLDDK
ncbi:regulatory protein RecX [Aliiglaciecola sp. CAU 1673]|uniref:regulatory protein RecX n=1 Tax=Aliiglaciecola sp. CAU 1673 TaxID=3032595 RepID=UPI0023DC4188|nr:regulatory protein RecX [Aliiglaciecola sp. CAU 1673]MDF2178256.1 regulatory protein RecX [Aliiglaciecola sp. CAU 1673]